MVQKPESLADPNRSIIPRKQRQASRANLGQYGRADHLRPRPCKLPLRDHDRPEADPFPNYHGTPFVVPHRFSLPFAMLVDQVGHYVHGQRSSQLDPTFGSRVVHLGYDQVIGPA